MTSFTLKAGDYTGPLDALLSLIEDRKLSVSQISLAEVCDAYLAYVEQLPELPLGETAQFIVIASTLLLIKSRTLLPSVELSSEETQSIEELEKRLARYALVRKAAKLLKQSWGVRQLFFPKRAPSRAALQKDAGTFFPGEASVVGIAEAMQRIIRTFPKSESLEEATVAPALALEEVIVRVRQTLQNAVSARWSEITKSANKHEAIVHFLAVLELVRNGSVSATQEKIFSDILLETDTVGTPSFI